MAENTNAAPAPEAAPNPDAKGLLDDVQPTPDDKTPADPSESTLQHKLEDPKPAPEVAKQRPAYIPEKFWDKEKNEPLTEQMAKSYSEMEKNFKLGKHKPPEGGKYDTAALTDKGIPADDKLLTEYTDWAAKIGLSQTAYDDLAEKVIAIAGGAADGVQISHKEELGKLGEQGPAIISSMVAWAQAKVSDGVWSKEDFDEFKVMGGTAQGMLALMKLRESYEGRVPLHDTLPTEIGMSDDELHQRVGHPDYHTNKGGFRDKTDRLFLQRYGNAAERAA